MAIKNPPKGYHTVTPELIVEGAGDALKFLVKALGAEQQGEPMVGPDGRVMHAEIQIGDSKLFLSDPMRDRGVAAQPASLYIYVDDCDSLYRRAVAAGAKSGMEPEDMFWGDRMSQVIDKWGNRWSISTRNKEMTEAEMKTAGEAWMKQMSQKK